MSDEGQSGGCQCGRVRFRIDGPLGRASICHCRMCQKAFGSFFGPLVSASNERFAWTRGEPAWFQSSNKVRRGFCHHCGTPLAYDWGGPALELAIGAFDNPEAVPPTMQTGLGHRLSWFSTLPDLPTRTPEEQKAADLYFADIVSLQHPDHDT